jgi:uncharacterized protein YbcI
MPEVQSEHGTVAAEITRGAVQLLREYTGRGPTKARTVISKDTVAIVLGETLTQGERTFVERGEQDHVLNTRHHLQGLMRNDLVRLVETESGRQVEAFMSANHVEPDYGIEFFVLEPLTDADIAQSPAESDPGAGWDMSEQNVQSVRSQYRSAARGEIRSLRWIDERIGGEHRWVSEPPGMVEPVDQPRWRPERFIDLQGRVLVRVKISGRARATGRETETRLAHLWTVSRGRPVKLAVYHDWEAGLEAAGVAE